MRSFPGAGRGVGLLARSPRNGGAVLLGRSPRKFPSTLTIATPRLAALVFAALSWCGSPGPQSAQWWCGSPGPQSAQVSKHLNYRNTTPHVQAPLVLQQQFPFSVLFASLLLCVRPSPRNRPRIPHTLDASLRSCLRPGRTAPRLEAPRLEAPRLKQTTDKPL